MLKTGDLVKGLYYGDKYQGTISKIRPYYGDDTSLDKYLVYYVDFEENLPLGFGGELTDGIVIQPQSQKSGKCTIEKL